MTRKLQTRVLAVICMSLAPAAIAQSEDAWPQERYLSVAQSACKNKNFDAFFLEFVDSPLVRSVYSANELVIVTNRAAGREVKTVPGKDYVDFPIATADYYWVKAEPVNVPGYDHIDLDITQVGDSHFRVDWVGVVYDGKSSGGDDPGNVIEIENDPGSFLFVPTDDCWELIMAETTVLDE
jgi:hypothetical protein